jgi:hypothetical protein
MLTTCPVAALASSHAHNAGAGAAPDNAPHDPERDAKPSGTPSCKIVCTNVHGERRKGRNSLVEHTTVPENLCRRSLCAGPRAAASRQLTCFAVHVADAAGSVPAAGHAPLRSPDTSGSPANAASVAPPADILYCNNAFANAAARTAVRILGADTAGADDDDSPLAACRCAKENDSGPREADSRCSSLGVKRQLRSEAFYPRSPSILLYQMCRIARSTAGAAARPNARFRAVIRALLTHLSVWFNCR